MLQLCFVFDFFVFRCLPKKSFIFIQMSVEWCCYISVCVFFFCFCVENSTKQTHPFSIIIIIESFIAFYSHTSFVRRLNDAKLFGCFFFLSWYLFYSFYEAMQKVKLNNAPHKKQTKNQKQKKKKWLETIKPNFAEWKSECLLNPSHSIEVWFYVWHELMSRLMQTNRALSSRPVHCVAFDVHKILGRAQLKSKIIWIET